MHFLFLVSLLLVLGKWANTRADISFTVNSFRNLNVIATSFKTDTSSGNFHVRFSSYKNVGQFKLEAPSVKIDSLFFENMEFAESDSMIQVDSTLFDFGASKGTVILRGLAFQLNSPKAKLISGAAAKNNLHLLIDECFIYADSLDGTFLSWATGPNQLGNIEIRKSFFVVKNASRGTMMELIGGNVILANNVFNFPGLVSSTVYKKIELRSNTINRSQFDLNGKFSGGVQAIFNIQRNLLAFPGSVDAFGGTQIWGMFINGFDELQSQMDRNEMGKGWQGFDFPSSSRFTKTGFVLDSLSGKKVTELWDWYIQNDSIAGINTGPNHREKKYNVFPGTKSIDFSIQSITGKAYFNSTLFPRYFSVTNDFTSPTSTVLFPELKILLPALGPIHFGPFSIDSISLGLQAKDGSPLLLAKEYQGPFNRQPTILANHHFYPSVFKNLLPTARYFNFAFRGNTSAGIGITPSTEIGLGDTLLFNKVDTAGYTTFYTKTLSPIPKDLRSLSKFIGFETTATLLDSMTFGLKDQVVPYVADNVYWKLEGSNPRFVKANGKPGTGGMVYAKTQVESPFNAYLVEKLSVPKGGKTFNTAEGFVRADAKDGYQIYIDSTASVDTTQFGSYSKAFQFTTIGRLDTDSLSLIQKWNPDFEAFKDSSGLISSVPFDIDSANLGHIQIVKSDGKSFFFVALKHNIFRDSLFNGPIDGLVELSNFKSAVSGRLRFTNVGDSIKEYSWKNKDTVFKNSRYVSGRELKGTSGLVSVQPWTATFPAIAHDRSKIEAWWSNGSEWKKIDSLPVYLNTTTYDVRVSQIPPDAKYVIIVERLLPAETYLKIDPPNLIGDSLHVTVSYRDQANKTIDQYCVEIRNMDQFGKSDSVTCSKRSVETMDVQKITSNLAYVYRIQYFTGGIPYGSPSWKPLDGPTWDPALVFPEAHRLKSQKKWHLLGFPFKGNLKTALKFHESTIPDKKILDSILVLQVKMEKGLPILDTVRNLGVGVNFDPGAAYLVAGTRAFDQVLELGNKFLPLQPYTIPLDSGWHLISNPFPTSISVKKIRSFKRSIPRIWNLVMSPGVPSNLYSWELDTLMKPFTGYAYYAYQNDSLTFDILTDSYPLGKVAGAPDWVQVELKSPWAISHMYLSHDGEDGNVPYFCSLNSGLELRIGGGAGYMIKSISEFHAIDESMEIRSTTSGIAKFSIDFPFGQTGSSDIKIRVVDLTTGRVYNQTNASELPISQGNRNYRLLIGNADFVDSKLASIFSSQSNRIALSQNFPNPARGLTSISLNIPVQKLEKLNAFLQVLDMQGRELQKLDLNFLRFGKQVVNLDASSFKPGLYIYRLTVVEGKSRTLLQKMMLVSP